MAKKLVDVMSNNAKDKYCELFINKLDSMEGEKYQKPWVAATMGAPANVYRQSQPYAGVNQFLLSIVCGVYGYNTSLFITPTQIKNENDAYKYKGLETNKLNIKIGKDGVPVMTDEGDFVYNRERPFPVFWFKRVYYHGEDVLTPEQFAELSEEEQEECRPSFWIKTYQVYNLDQTNFATEYAEEYKAITAIKHDYKHGTKDDVLEAMIEGGKWRCKINYGGVKSYYDVKEDYIRLPRREAFLGDEQFYGTALHEMFHSTGKELHRFDDTTNFATIDTANENRVKEEITVELATACFMSMLGLGKLLDTNHMVYVEGWRNKIRSNRNWIVEVIDDVQRAVNAMSKYYNKVAKELHPLALPLAA